MIFSTNHTGGATATAYKIKPDFKVETKLALSWFQTASGEWQCTDRGSDADQYDASIRLYGTESAIDSFVNQIEYNRSTGDNQITLSNFNSQEHIFGADIDYSVAITATAFLERRKQNTWRGFEQSLRLSARLPLTFLSGYGAMPVLRYLDVGYDGDSDRTINKYDSYNRAFFYQDHTSDFGTFTGIFTFTDEEAKQFRRYAAAQRGLVISIPDIIGVTKPFGWRSGSYPINAKIIGWEDQGVYSIVDGVPRWRMKITLAESFEIVYS